MRILLGRETRLSPRVQEPVPSQPLSLLFEQSEASVHHLFDAQQRLHLPIESGLHQLLQALDIPLQPLDAVPRRIEAGINLRTECVE